MVKVAVVGGEGIGPEVTAQSQRVLNWFAAKRGVPMTLREAQYGIIPYLATGKVLPDDTVEAMEEADAILWGATGGPETKEVPAAARKAGSLLGLRSKYDLYANLRPIVANPALADSAPLKAQCARRTSISSSSANSPAASISASRAASKRCADGQRRGFNTEQYTTNQIRRVARSAFELARTRQEQGLLGRQGQRAGDQRAVARGSHRAASRKNFPMSSSPISMSTTPRCRSCASPRSST